MQGLPSAVPAGHSQRGPAAVFSSNLNADRARARSPLVEEVLAPAT